jgi:hypothetical protein
VTDLLDLNISSVFMREQMEKRCQYIIIVFKQEVLGRTNGLLSFHTKSVALKPQTIPRCRGNVTA